MEAHAHAPAPGVVRNYILVLCILGVLTFLECMTYFIPWFQEHRQVLFVAISIMGTVKFGLVVAFYMHLRHDAVFYREVFLIPLILAVVITIIVTMLTSIRLIPYQHL
jgi:cytochrome c oxidase subunit 4